MQLTIKGPMEECVVDIANSSTYGDLLRLVHACVTVLLPFGSLDFHRFL